MVTCTPLFTHFHKNLLGNSEERKWITRRRGERLNTFAEYPYKSMAAARLNVDPGLSLWDPVGPLSLLEPIIRSTPTLASSESRSNCSYMDNTIPLLDRVVLCWYVDGFIRELKVNTVYYPDLENKWYPRTWQEISSEKSMIGIIRRLLLKIHTNIWRNILLIMKKQNEIWTREIFLI